MSVSPFKRDVGRIGTPKMIAIILKFTSGMPCKYIFHISKILPRVISYIENRIIAVPKSSRIFYQRSIFSHPKP